MIRASKMTRIRALCSTYPTDIQEDEPVHMYPEGQHQMVPVQQWYPSAHSLSDSQPENQSQY